MFKRKLHQAGLMVYLLLSLFITQTIRLLKWSPGNTTVVMHKGTTELRFVGFTDVLFFSHFCVTHRHFWFKGLVCAAKWLRSGLLQPVGLLFVVGVIKMFDEAKVTEL